ncbi:unnamed protein product [Aureobasidium vineae]|uniref:Efflux pump antibiotic resistance protein n=1 Tax=Aureobasidium vineae TaxID=2773715 RepID=A0A9N8P722_9PEZI|nr:unnamed protein product [Aureobasidium vineae]
MRVSTRIDTISSLILRRNIAPVIGGVIVERSTWRWLFYINIPFCVISLAAVPFAIRYSRPKTTTKDQLLPINWMGILLSIASTTLFLIGISWGGTEYSWSSATTLCPLVLGLVGVVCTIVYEMKYASTPFLQISIFHNRSAITAYICTVLTGLSIYATLYYLVLWLVAVKKISEIMAGVCTLPLGLTVVPISGIAGGIITRIGTYHAAVQAVSPTKDIAYASSMFAFMRSLGLCLGVSIGGTIFQNLLSRRLEYYGLSTELANNAEVYVALIRSSPLSPEKILLKDVMSWAFQRLFAALSSISGLGLVVSVLVGKCSLDKDLDSQHIIE